MSIWVISDLHLAFGAPEKTMEVFGKQWEGYPEKIKRHWERLVMPDDLILIPGDISWAKHLEDALIDLRWIDALPGKKLLLKGNHDYWWASKKKLEEKLPPSISCLQQDAFTWNDIALGGARLWDTVEYTFQLIPSQKSLPKLTEEERNQQEKIYDRELGRLERSLSQLNPSARYRIAMTHYPPLGPDLKPSRAATLLETYKIDICVFGHLHNIPTHSSLFGEKNGVRYLLTAADYIDFKPIQLLNSSGQLVYKKK